MKPVLVSLGPFHLYSFGLMVALGVLLSLYLMRRRARRDGFPDPDTVYDLVFITIFSGFAGARLFYIVENFSWYIERPLKILAFWEGGIIFYGGVIVSLGAVILYLKAKKKRVLDSFDFLMPYIALTHAFGRVGCFLNGCCYGRVCDLPWAVTFPGLEGARHPTQLYEALYNLALFFFLSRQYSKKRASGEIMALYFGLYAAGRFGIEFWRADNPGWGFLTWNQWGSILIFSLALLFYLYRLRVSPPPVQDRLRKGS